MTETNKCPQCGAELPTDAPSGICPKCLLAAGLASDTNIRVGRSDEAPTTPLPHSSRFVPPSPVELSRQFPQLEILELIGAGGMGAVYKARQPGLDRLVAVKILPPEVGADPAFAQRFTREAQALARLGHQHIVSVFDFGVAGGLYYFIMEYVDGANLRQLIKSGELKPAEALAIVPQICEALQFAHDEGVVHRDIKPENILLDKRGRVKIADFGLARLLGADAPEISLTGTNQVLGTLHYMAPEQIQGLRTIDHRADIYSLGVVFYEMLTGELPLGRFAPPSQKVEVDVRLDEVVLRSLESEPKRRYQQVSEVKTDVESISAIERAPSGNASTEGVAEDFLLMNPQLPKAARWITAYAIVVRPLLWLLAISFVVLGFESSLVGNNPEADVINAEAAIDHAIEFLAGIFDFVFVVVVAIGGFKLRALRRGAERWILVGLALGAGLGLLVIILQLTFTPWRIEQLREIARTNPTQLIADDFTQKEIDAILTDKEYPILVPEVIGDFARFSWLVLDIIAFVWLWRNGRYLPLFDATVLKDNAERISPESSVGPVVSDAKSDRVFDSGTALGLDESDEERQRAAELAESAPAWLPLLEFVMFGLSWIFAGAMWNFRTPGWFVATFVLATTTYLAIRWNLVYLPKLRGELRRQSPLHRGFALVMSFALFGLGMLFMTGGQTSLWKLIGRTPAHGPALTDAEEQLRAALKTANFQNVDHKLNLIELGPMSYSTPWLPLILLFFAFWLFVAAAAGVIDTRRYRNSWRYNWAPALTVASLLVASLVLVEPFFMPKGIKSISPIEIRGSADKNELRTAIEQWSTENGYRVSLVSRGSAGGSGSRPAEPKLVEELKPEEVAPFYKPGDEEAWFNRDGKEYLVKDNNVFTRSNEDWSDSIDAVQFSLTRPTDFDLFRLGWKSLYRPRPPLTITCVTRSSSVSPHSKDTFTGVGPETTVHNAFVRIEPTWQWMNSSEATLWPPILDDLRTKIAHVAETAVPAK